MANAILFDILTQIRTDIQALTLPGIGAANIVIQKVPSTRDKDLPATKFPCVIIAPFGAESMESAGNLRDDVVYPVAVVVMASEKDEAEQPQEQQAKNFEMYLKWRETIRKSFIQQRLTSSLVFKIELQPLDIVDRAAWFDRNVFASGLVLRCHSRESRG